jgi:outer membrane protein assembly factor BamB
LYALDIKTHALKWKFRTKRKMMSSPAVDEEAGMAYVGSHDGCLYAVNLETGKKAWSYKTEGAVQSSPIIVTTEKTKTKVLLVGSCDGFIYMIRAKDGSLVWRYKLDYKMTSVPVVSDGMLFVSSDRSFYAFR